MLYPEDAELLFQEALILRGLGGRSRAEACLLQLLQSQEGDHFARVDPGLRRIQGPAQPRRTVPGSRSTFRGRGPVEGRCQRASRFHARVAGIRRASSRPGPVERARTAHTPIESVSRGRGGRSRASHRALLKRKEFSSARAILEPVIAHNPRALRPRVILSHVLLQDGRDLLAAESALRDILTLDPGNAEAGHNLAVLLSKASGRA